MACAHLFLDSPGFSLDGYSQENEQASSVDMSPVIGEKCLIQEARQEGQTARLVRASFLILTFFGTMSIRDRLRGSFARCSQSGKPASTSDIVSTVQPYSP